MSRAGSITAAAGPRAPDVLDIDAVSVMRGSRLVLDRPRDYDQATRR